MKDRRGKNKIFILHRSIPFRLFLGIHFLNVYVAICKDFIEISHAKCK